MNLKIFKFKKVLSTNNTAIQKVKNGFKNGVVISHEQSKGKGRLGRKWISIKGNLFVSYFFEINKNFNIAKLTNLNFKIIKNCLEKIIKKKIKKKIPNDLMVNNMKIGGILQEITNYKGKFFIVIGIGVNIVKSPKIDKYKKIYLNNFLKTKKSKNSVFYYLNNEFKKNINNMSKCI